MKKFIIIFLILLTGLPAFSKTITGEIKKEHRDNSNRIYDAQTNVPLEGVLVKIPAKNYATKTDADGIFKLETKLDSPAILSLEKSGYKPYSMTLSQNSREPIQVGIEKTTPKDIIVDTDMVHIGDNSFSPRSANASDFSISSAGAFYTKSFEVNTLKQDEDLFLVIGSIIGIDTIQAQRLGQSGVLTAYSSPPEIFFNEHKIAEIKINGDNQKILVPKSLIKSVNNVTIKAGKNLYKTSDVDFDDIEFTNLLFEIK